jgi:hypothetical protein
MWLSWAIDDPLDFLVMEGSKSHLRDESPWRLEVGS